MKSINTIYWIFTVLLVLLMLASGISSFIPNPQGIEMMKHLGYPYNILMLLGVGKILGVIAILVPGYPRLKEWAYAGFTFDLIGALYAGLSTGDPILKWIGVLLGLVFVFGSYIYYHKRLTPKQA